MQTRIMIIIAIIGLAVIWYGSTQLDKFIALLGIFLFTIGLVGAYLSARNKRGMGFLRRL